MGKHRENKCDIDPDLFCFIVCNCRRLCGVVLQPCYKMLKCQREVWSSSLTQYYAELNPPGKKKKKRFFPMIAVVRFVLFSGL